MPRFFFHIHDGRYIEDEEGTELPSLDDAISEALQSARSIMREAIWTGKLPLGERIDIADETGRTLHSLPFREAVSIEE